MIGIFIALSLVLFLLVPAPKPTPHHEDESVCDGVIERGVSNHIGTFIGSAWYDSVHASVCCVYMSISVFGFV